MSAKCKGLGGWWLAFLFSVASLMAADNEIRPAEEGLVEAVKQGDREAVRSLLQENADVNAAQADGATALAWAATSMSPSMMTDEPRCMQRHISDGTK